MLALFLERTALETILLTEAGAVAEIHTPDRSGRSPGAVHRILAALYQRYGSLRYTWGAAGVALAMGLVTLGVTGLWGSRYLRLSFTQAAGAFWVAAAFLVPAALTVLWCSRDMLAPMLRWSEQRSSERAEEAWAATIRAPGTMCLRLLVTVLSAGIPVAALIVPIEGLSWGSAAGVYMSGVVGLLAALVLVVFGAEIALRPVVEDIVPYLPPDFVPATRVPRLDRKALGPFLPVTLFAALLVGAYTNVLGSGLLRLALAIGIGVGTVALAGLVFSIVTRAVLQPVDELVAATHRVSDGDIDTPVPVLTGDELGTLASAFNGMLAGLRQHERELREAQERIVASASDARRRVERDLHDGAQQRLVLLGLKLGLAERLAETDPTAAVGQLPEVRAELNQALEELRDLAHGIYPQVLESEGIPAALREAASRSPIPVDVQSNGAGRYRQELEAAVYFCCLEALQNAAKHAGEDARAGISLAERQGVLQFEVSDDGRGFDPELPGRAGIQNMIDRIGALGGTLSVASAPGSGTVVRGQVPTESARVPHG